MATFGKGVEYALHCLLYLVDDASGATFAVGDIAKLQGISETYLAKVFTKLKKAGVVRSSTGANGGYELARPAEQVTFWDVVVAVEGELNLFECRNIRANSALSRYRNKKEKSACLISGPCEIHKVMMGLEKEIQTSLQTKNLGWLSQEVSKKIPKREMEKAIQWFSQLGGDKS